MILKTRQWKAEILLLFLSQIVANKKFDYVIDVRKKTETFFLSFLGSLTVKKTNVRITFVGFVSAITINVIFFIQRKKRKIEKQKKQERERETTC